MTPIAIQSTPAHISNEKREPAIAVRRLPLLSARGKRIASRTTMQIAASVAQRYER